MRFADAITRLPLPLDPARAEAARAACGWASGDLAALIAGTAGSSPYLAGLIERETDWLHAALEGWTADADPVAAQTADLQGSDPAALGAGLRRAKRRVALLAALADLGGVWPLARVTGALTALADRAVDLSFRAHLAAEQARGRMPQGGADAGGLIVLAMGKMGAAELNYSSDIDLIVLYDDDAYDPADRQEARAGLIKVTRRAAATLSDLTAEGYVFRTDLRLRPDASVTPVCISASAALDYYEAEGRTWERAAYIKARPCACDLAAGGRFLNALRPFVWRKHLDFAAIEDAHAMRLRIRDHKGLHGRIEAAGHDMKLGQGGIREIEFFTQTRQLIAGGRDPALRVRGTVEGLAALAGAGWVPEDVAAELTEHYRHHREVEHRVQMVGDAQTHTLPAAGPGLDAVARLSGAPDTAAWAEAIRTRLARVEALTGAFFAPAEAQPRPALSPQAEALIAGWRGYPALRSDRARQVFGRIEADLLTRLARAADPEAALGRFDRFLAGLPAGVQVFSLFEANPQLVDLVADICGTAPGLAAYFARHPGVLDSVIAGSFFAPWPGAAGLRVTLEQALAAAMEAPGGGYERALDAARRQVHDWQFRIGVHHLRGLIDAEEAGAHYADLADAVLAALFALVVAEFARRHGPPPGRGAAVMGMGSLGARRLNAGSDLDLIVIYDAAGIEASDGPRPLAARPYYARLTQALLTALTAPTAEGRLYEVDMRLRPSGRQGPVATALPAFRDYQLAEAWTWEHLALTRARIVACCGPGEPQSEAGLATKGKAAGTAARGANGTDPAALHGADPRGAGPASVAAASTGPGAAGQGAAAHGAAAHGAAAHGAQRRASAATAIADQTAGGSESAGERVARSAADEVAGWGAADWAVADRSAAGRIPVATVIAGQDLLGRELAGEVADRRTADEVAGRDAVGRVVAGRGGAGRTSVGTGIATQDLHGHVSASQATDRRAADAVPDLDAVGHAAEGATGIPAHVADDAPSDSESAAQAMTASHGVGIDTAGDGAHGPAGPGPQQTGEALAGEVEALRREVLAARGSGARVMPDLADMRRRLFAAKPWAGSADVKNGPGRLQDIELLAQSLALRAADPARATLAQLRGGRRAGLIDAAGEATLARAFRLFWRVHAALKLVDLRGAALDGLGHGAAAFVLREAGADDLVQLAGILDSTASAAGAVIESAVALASEAPDGA